MEGTLNTVRTFKALGHETRLRIVTLLASRSLCVCHFEAALQLSQVTVSRHLSVLRAAGLVESQRDGLWVHYRLADPKNEFEKMLFDWLKSRARTDKSLREDLSRMRECVQMPLQDVVELVRN
jgi:DNA-binding transcriptional ArsR family regulator